MTDFTFRVIKTAFQTHFTSPACWEKKRDKLTLTLGHSILILFIKTKHAPFRLALYSFTNCLFSLKNKPNTSFSNLFVFYLFSFYLLYNKRIKPCYVNCVGLIKTCYSRFG